MPEIKLKKRYKCAGDIYTEFIKHSDWSVESIVEFLNSIPDADVVEVCRCKECDYSEQMDSLYCHYFNKNVDEDDFCSQGG